MPSGWITIPPPTRGRGRSPLDHDPAVLWITPRPPPKSHRAIRHGAHVAPPALARELLQRGAAVDEHAVFSAVSEGNTDTAFILLDALGAEARSLGLAIRARERALDAEHSAKRIEAGTLWSNVTPAEHRALAARLNDLADRVDPTLRGGRPK